LFIKRKTASVGNDLMGYFERILDIYLIDVLMRLNQTINGFNEVIEIGVCQPGCFFNGVSENETVLNEG
jgi:hypothetical protein